MLQILTQVLDILVGGQSHNTALLTGPHAGTVRLVDDNAIGDTGGNETCAVCKGCPRRVVVEGDVGQSVSQRRQKQSNVAGKPGELKGLREGS